MSQPTAVTMFSGGGFAALALKRVGFQIVGAVEYDRAIAACYAQNVGPVEVVDLATVVARFFARWIGVYLLQVSPPCPNFSSAKTGGYETALDYRLAGAVCRALRVMQPAAFILENVRGYLHSASYARILHTLAALGYTVHSAVLNAADWGVPQTRERLIVRAVRDYGRIPALEPTHRKGGDMFHAPWVGWYAAIEDLIPTLPASRFAPWQLERLPAELCDTTLVTGTEMRDFTTRRADEPIWAVSASAGYKGAPRAFLMDSQQTNSARGSESPAFTTTANVAKGMPRAFLMADSKDKFGDGRREATEPAHTLTVQAATHPMRAWLEAGRVVQLTPRALARFQTIPDNYVLPDKASLACRIIGNGVPCLLIERLAAQLLPISEAIAA